MTRKDYERFAAMFAGELAIAAGNSERSIQVLYIILSTADIFQQDNDRFDRNRFYRACGAPQLVVS